MMEIKTAEFLISNTDPAKCPPANKPEFAFIGRSNVGKSSLINMLTNRKDLAKTSSTPGKTQTINHFLINKHWYLVDLPGYGYAAVGKKVKESWPKMIAEYATSRSNLYGMFVLIDCRLEPQQIDLDFISWLGSHQIPMAIIFTKTDKVKQNELAKNRNLFEKKLLEQWEELPPLLITSAEKKTGRQKVLDFIEEAIEQGNNNR